MTAPTTAARSNDLQERVTPLTGISRKYIAVLVAALLALTGMVVLRLTVFGEGKGGHRGTRDAIGTRPAPREAAGGCSRSRRVRRLRGTGSFAGAEFAARAYPADPITVAEADAFKAAFAAASKRHFPTGKGQKGTWVTIGPRGALPLQPATQLVPLRAQ
jgi:hypothetical protein